MMMSKLQLLREKLHLTQEEVAQRSGISVRTIQLIEAGQVPKGYTLRSLAQTLGNLSSLPFSIIPPSIKTK